MLANILAGPMPKTEAAIRATRRIGADDAKVRANGLTDLQTDGAARVVAAIWLLGDGMPCTSTVRSRAALKGCRAVEALLWLASMGVIECMPTKKNRHWRLNHDYLPDVCERLAGVSAQLCDVLRAAGEYHAAEQAAGRGHAGRNRSLRKITEQRRRAAAATDDAARLADIARDLAKMADETVIGRRAAKKLENMAAEARRVAALISQGWKP